MIDFGRIESAAADANYVLTDITLHVSGTAVLGSCPECGDDTSFFKVQGSGQTLELAESMAQGPVHISAIVDGWKGGHTRLVIE
jgi:uncharacterized protein (DUF779 family)